MKTFNSLYANQYDQLYAEKNYASECDLVTEAVKRYATTTPHSLLDVGCGTGGHAIELACRGYKVTGVDLSQAMLDRADDKAVTLPTAQRPQWLCGDARSFDTGSQYDLGIMMFAVVGYLTTNDDVLAGLRNIHKHLKPGALFICDFWYGPSVLSVRPTDRVRILPTSEGKVIRAASTTLDIANHTADVTFKLWALQKNELVSETSETHKMRYFFPQEFVFFLTQAGFSIKNISAFPNLDEAITDQNWNALVIAQAL